jgi:hypothetical protein
MEMGFFVVLSFLIRSLIHVQVGGQLLHLRDYPKLGLLFSRPNLHNHDGYFVGDLGSQATK